MGVDDALKDVSEECRSNKRRSRWDQWMRRMRKGESGRGLKQGDAVSRANSIAFIACGSARSKNSGQQMKRIG